jgi:hypothetical protein
MAKTIFRISWNRIQVKAPSYIRLAYKVLARDRTSTFTEINTSKIKPGLLEFTFSNILIMQSSNLVMHLTNFSLSLPSISLSPRPHSSSFFISNPNVLLFHPKNIAFT